MPGAPNSIFLCHACDGEVPVLDAPALRYLVGSDCTPVTGDLQIGVCSTCGLLQKAISTTWQELCKDIYGNYQIYHQAAGVEQKARSSAGGEFAPRSDLIAGYLRKSVDLTRSYSVLDVGCGNGGFLRSIVRMFSDWSVAGSDLNEAFGEDVRSLCARAKFLRSDELSSTTETFDVVSLIHCLEHIPNPVAYLAQARRLIKSDGFLLIEVPDAELNPFDLVVADHASHMTKAILQAIVEAAGYEVVECGNQVVGKEITLLARPLHGKSTSPLGPLPGDAGVAARRNLSWLNATLQLGVNLSRARRPFGIFGTSIAGMWMGSALSNQVDFYVDEDNARIGRTYLDAPIIEPLNVPCGATVYVCLEPRLAAILAMRHRRPKRDFVLPPSLD